MRWPGFGGSFSPVQAGAERIEATFQRSSFSEILQSIPELKSFAIKAGIPIIALMDPSSPVMTSSAVEAVTDIRLSLFEIWKQKRFSNRTSTAQIDQIIVSQLPVLLQPASQLNGNPTGHLGLYIDNERAMIVRRIGEKYAGAQTEAAFKAEPWRVFVPMLKAGCLGLTRDQAMEASDGQSGDALRGTIRRIRDTLLALDVTVKHRAYQLIENGSDAP